MNIKYNFKDIGLENYEKYINDKILRVIINTEESKMILKNKNYDV